MDGQKWIRVRDRLPEKGQERCCETHHGHLQGERNMSTFEVVSTVTRESLMNKSKADLVHEILHVYCPLNGRLNADNARLKADVARLTAEVEILRDSPNFERTAELMRMERDTLRATNEKLVEALRDARTDIWNYAYELAHGNLTQKASQAKREVAYIDEALASLHTEAREGGGE